jgi:PAS domain S-box-containing protein
MSGMFGPIVLMSAWAITHVYVILLLFGAVGSAPAVSRLLTYVLAIELPFAVSFFLWHDQTEAPGSVKLAGGVGTSDISQDMLINSIAESVVVIDGQGTVQVFNPAAEATSGWNAGDTRGLDYRNVLTLIDEKGQPILAENDPIARVFASAQTVADNDIRLRTRNNKIVELSLVASPIMNSQGVSAVVAVFRDVSEERSQERQRAEFISTASHEMRTPVAAIEGYLALALNEGVSKIDSKAREYLAKAHQSTQHLGKLFQDLLTAAKTEDGRLEFHPQVVEVGAFLDQLAEDVRFAAEKKGLIMEYQSGNSEPGNSVTGAQVLRPLYFAHIDPERVREVVTNLFDNAVKYTAEGKIVVSLGGDDANIVISVSDTGPGIAAEDIPHLFQKFYRVDNSQTRQIGGTGLGLFIARKIIEKSGGKIWVESVPAQGSQFFVSLPRLRPDQAEALQKKEALNETPLAHVTGNVEI